MDSSQIQQVQDSIFDNDLDHPNQQESILNVYDSDLIEKVERKYTKQAQHL